MKLVCNENHTLDVWFKKRFQRCIRKKTSFGKIRISLSTETKYRRQVIYGKIKEDIGQILRQLCEYKKVEIIDAEACRDHIYILVYHRK